MKDFLFLFQVKSCRLLLPNMYITHYMKQESTSIHMPSLQSVHPIQAFHTFYQRSTTGCNQFHQHTRCIQFQPSRCEHRAGWVLLYPSTFQWSWINAVILPNFQRLFEMWKRSQCFTYIFAPKIDNRLFKWNIFFGHSALYFTVDSTFER